MEGNAEMHECGNCGVRWNLSELHAIDAYHERVDEGGTVPSGQCPDPECGALCYPASPDTVPDAAPDARLFADLLKALHDIHKLSLCPEPRRIRDWSARCDVMADYARKAIAKAEGR